jgi:hypothetical protein
MKEKVNLSDKLKIKKKITEEFEVMLNGLTLEEIIGLKIELSARNLKGKFFGINLINTTKRAATEAVILYAINSCWDDYTATFLLGTNLKEFFNMKSKFLKSKRLEQINGDV